MFNKENVGNQNIFNYQWGLVMSGGGAKGSYQAGALKALFECGITNNIIAASGTSIGSINMCLLSQGDSELGNKLWKKVKPIDMIEVTPELIDGKEGFSSRSGLIKILKNNIDFSKMRKSFVDYYATVSQYISQEDTNPTAKYIKIDEENDDDLINILLASSALPIVYEPVKMDGYIYKDGGLTDNVPIKVLYEKGIRNFIVMLLSHNKKINIDKYPGAKFIIIKPSKDLGNTIDGTLNFDKNQINFRYKLGYADAVRTLKYYDTEISRSPSFEMMWDSLVYDDYNSIQTEMMIEKGEKNFNSKKNKIDEILSKYGIE